MRQLFFISVFVFCGFTGFAQTSSDLLTQINALDAAVQNGLKSANNVLSEQQRTLFINMTNYTAYLRENLKDVLDDAGNVLKDSENRLFNEVSAYLAQVNAITSGIQVNIQEVTLSLENAIARLPLARRNPAPAFIDVPTLTTVQQKTIDIRIRGVRLENSRNHIVFNGKKYANPLIPTEKENLYRIVLNETDVFNPDTLNVLEIYLFKRRKKFKFTALVSVVPKKIGIMTITYRTKSDSTVISGTFSEDVTSSPGGTGWKEVNRQIGVRSGAGWKIDRNSIRVQKTQGAQGGSSCAVSATQITEISFVGQANGRCKKKFPAGVECGTTRCRFTWNEVKIVDNFRERTEVVEINFNEQKVIRFPQNIEVLVKSEITFFDGTTFTSIEPAFDRNFIHFRFDLGRKVAEASFKP